jgi:hypothetical protein
LPKWYSTSTTRHSQNFQQVIFFTFCTISLGDSDGKLPIRNSLGGCLRQEVGGQKGNADLGAVGSLALILTGNLTEEQVFIARHTPHAMPSDSQQHGLLLRSEALNL